MLTQETGPFRIFERIREFTGAEKPGELTGFWPMLFSCIFCMSVYTTLASYILWLLEPTIVMLGAAMTLALIPNYFAKPE